MPNNFKLTGDYYVSKAGNDASDGLTPNTPKRTIQAALNLATTGTKSIIVGSGVYNETISKSATSQTINVYADGYSVLDFSFGKTFTYNTGNSNLSFFNFEIRNCTSFVGVQVLFTDCKLVNLMFYPFNTTTTPFVMTRCTALSCVFDTRVGGPTGTTFTTSGTSTINSCLFINTISYINVTSILNTYIDNTSAVYGISSIAAANFNFNNLQGIIVMNAASSATSGVIQDTFGRYYDLSQAGNGGSGSLLEPYKRGDTLAKPFNFSNHRVAYPTFNASSSAVDPRFNNTENQDFTLQANSPLLGRASDGINNVGGVKFANRYPARSGNFSGSLATVDGGLTFLYDNYVISGSSVTGSVTSGPIAVNSTGPKVIQKVTYNGLLAFNKDTGSASGSNQNVPDFDTFTSASLNAAANPDRLVYYMRHTTGSSIPVTDAGWENGGLWTAGQYNVFEWNTKPSIDNLGVGNGSGSFNAAASPTFIQATWVQMQIKLRNDYLL